MSMKVLSAQPRATKKNRAPGPTYEELLAVVQKQDSDEVPPDYRTLKGWASHWGVTYTNARTVVEKLSTMPGAVTVKRFKVVGAGRNGAAMPITHYKLALPSSS